MKSRRGVVLLLALLCIISLEVAAVGLHYATVQEIRAARSFSRRLDLDLAVRSAALRTVAEWPASGAEGLPVHGVLEMAEVLGPRGMKTRIRIERVERSLFLIRATGASPLRETTSVGLLVASATPTAIVRTMTAAIRTDGLLLNQTGSRISSGAVGCGFASGNAVELSGTDSSRLIGPGRIDGAVVDSLRMAAVIGSLTFDRLMSMTDVRHGTAASLHTARNDTIIRPTTGTVVLVVDGDVRMEGGNFRGILVVRGALTVTDAATIEGAVIVLGGPTTIDRSTVTFDPCAILDAAQVPSLLSPYRPHGRRWIPLF